MATKRAVKVFCLLAALARAQTVTLDVDISASHEVLEQYASVSMDWWPSTSAGSGGDWAGATALEIDLTSARLRSFAKAAAPGLLRVGGSMDTVVRYTGFSDVDDAAWCNAPRLWRGANTTLCLNASRFDELYDFANASGLGLVFGLSYPGVDGGAGDDSEDVPPYNGTMNRDLLRYVERTGRTLAAVELGEEMVPAPNSTSYRNLVDAYRTLRADLDDIFGTRRRGWWPPPDEKNAARPRVLGPCVGMASETGGDPACDRGCAPDAFFTAFANDTLGAHLVDAVCAHSYNNDGPWTRPSFANQTLRQLDAIRQVVGFDPVEGGLAPQIWCGECGPHNDGGIENVTDTAMSTFWYLDSLGAIAELGVVQFGRQALAGSHYGLLDPSKDFEPNPDFYVLALWSRLMGRDVNRVAGNPHDDFHVYAHGGPELGAITMAFVNLGDEKRFNLTVAGVPAGPRRAWRLSAPDVTSKTLLLNGEPLATAGSQLPRMDPVHEGADTDFVVGAQTLGFVRLLWRG
mmetsp:Transcript_2577/g.7554  ORF Transcript_2577/g.7554 Transcript_2577/m.7554 type:complete len:517 (-) Transcript_2577:32-1582(-)